jgi:hypothetical protein
MQFDKAKTFILKKLKSELPSRFTYHCFDHTTDVYNAAKMIGAAEHSGPYEMKLLLTAALYHDSGFVDGSAEHEAKSCEIARRCLPGFDYTSKDIEKVCGMIMATRLPQSPQNLPEQILCDADLDYLGRDDFFPISDLLFEEFKMMGIVANERDWNIIQVKFFENHHYFTRSSQKLRNEKKQQNLDAIKSKIN